jgi:predicted Zn-ribbon and HTH transcriptional regulator
MTQEPAKPFIPPERHETIRRQIVELIGEQVLSAREISAGIGISIKEVYGHLEHIHRSLVKRDHHLAITPAECKKCGFIFRKRERFNKPGKCPVCRSESIEEPLFSIRKE